MDYFGAEISKKIKSAIRAKLVELGVYVDDELPDYIMVLVANKKTKKQMEKDLTLFLNTHTIHFVEWLTQVLEKLQSITQSKDKDADSEEKGIKAKKDREKKRKSSEGVPAVIKKAKPEDIPKEKTKKRPISVIKKSKKDKEAVNEQVEIEPVKAPVTKAKVKETREIREAKISREKETREVKEIKEVKEKDIRHENREISETREVKSREAKETREVKDNHSPVAAKSVDKPVRPSSKIVIKRTITSEVAIKRKSADSAPAERERERRPRIKAPSPSPPPKSSAIEEDEDHDVLNLSAEEDELKEAAPVRRSMAVAPTRHTSAATPEAVRRTAAKEEKTVRLKLSSRDDKTAAVEKQRVERVSKTDKVALREERLSSKEKEETKRRRSRSPVRRRRVQVQSDSISAARAELRTVRPTPQSTVGAVVSREVDEPGYDPLQPSVGAVASTVRVTERPRRPAADQPRPTLLLKAMRDAQRSTVASVPPFIVRDTPSTREKERHKNSSLDRDRLGSGGPDREPAPLRRRRASPRDDGSRRAVRAKNSRGDSPGQIAITVRNRAVALPADDSPMSYHTATPDEPMSPAAVSPEPAGATSNHGSPVKSPLKGRAAGTAAVEEAAGASPEAPSSDEEDTVNVTIGRVESRPQKQPPSDKSESAPLTPSEEDNTRTAAATPTSAEAENDRSTVVERANSTETPASANGRPRSPTTFVVTMTGLDSSRFPGARGADGPGPAGEPALAVDEEILIEEEEEEEEEIEEEDLRQQLLAETALKAVKSVVTAPAPSPIPATLNSLTRCRFWPGCRLGDKCTFQHPSQPCSKFPACPLGDSCLYIHPPCKYDSACTRPDCRFSHSKPFAGGAPATSGGLKPAPAAPPAGAAALTRQTSQECKFFPFCTNASCPYIHPKVCRYGSACTNPSCLFVHGAPAAAGRPTRKWVAPNAQSFRI